MSKNAPNKIKLTDSQKEQEQSSQDNDSFHFAGIELEKRYTPLVVIAIIAILIGLLLPAVQ